MIRTLSCCTRVGGRGGGAYLSAIHVRYCTIGVLNGRELYESDTTSGTILIA